MKPIDRREILPIGEYEQIRPHFRARIIEEKKARRVPVGDILSVVFENRDSVLLQVQEMLRTERITSEPSILHEIETYNELVPGASELSLTCFVEISDKPRRERTLVELAGLEESFGVEVDGRLFPAKGQRPDGFAEGRTTAVHYLKVALDESARAAIQRGDARASIVVRHPKLDLRAELGARTLKALGEDLAAA